MKSFKKSAHFGRKIHRKKALKQVISSIQNKKWAPDAATYVSVGAHVSTRMPNKYSDISGLLAKYTHPASNLRYANADEFREIEGMTQLEIRERFAFRGVLMDPLFS
eukprot:m.260456 g.260456  ORF g.260456 m.260456 type:complete len:107 (-) comp39961_c0_seq1:143-463(-)